jgi:hypothetical protein
MREQFTFVDVGHLWLWVGNTDELLSQIGEDDPPDALVLVDDQRLRRTYSVLTESEAWTLSSLNLELRRAASQLAGFLARANSRAAFCLGLSPAGSARDMNDSGFSACGGSR